MIALSHQTESLEAVPAATLIVSFNLHMTSTASIINDSKSSKFVASVIFPTCNIQTYSTFTIRGPIRKPSPVSTS
jgi:hypothetical protein